MGAAFRKVALIGKQTPEIARSLRVLRELLRKRGCEVMIERDTAAIVGDGSKAGKAVSYAEIGKRADLAIVVGGDGTMLAAARNLVRYGVPLAGVNQGRLGFMTDIALDQMGKSVGALLSGKHEVEERSLLDAEVRRGRKSLLRTLALNEAVVTKGSQARLIEFQLRIDGVHVYRLRADGVIVATPTGSTAYALSAQGPILHPKVPAFALVPLNPHVLSARPVSVSDSSVIEIALLHAVDARAHFDGFALTDLQEGDRLILKRSADAIRFVHPPGYSYFTMLREKLRWSNAVGNPSDD
ncbi:MAG TPA: NAD(+)/NADH kinase [Burkholderiales bacterium]|jgi:NAD+ kinase|nr:NAD(+)/NADH kinase [Burkholderiales bacterium]